MNIKGKSYTSYILNTYSIYKTIFIVLLIYTSSLLAQNNRTTVRDGFMSTLTDARAAGQGDIGVATSTDTFSQYWNPSKYVFSDQKCAIGIVRSFGSSDAFNSLNQFNLIFYNQLNTRSAYSLGFRGYSYETSQRPFNQTENDFQFTQTSIEASIEGSYTLRLSETFAMSVGGRFIFLDGKTSFLDVSNGTSSSYGIDVAGFYSGKEMAFKKFNGRWRAGFNFSNLRNNSSIDQTNFKIYAPSTLSVGSGFDFIFNPDNILELTTEYKIVLDSTIKNARGESLDLGLGGSIAALGLEYEYREQFFLRTGYSYGINRLTDSFIPMGVGFKTRYLDVDIAYLSGLSQEENPIREKSRLSLIFNLEELF